MSPVHPHRGPPAHPSCWSHQTPSFLVPGLSHADGCHGGPSPHLGIPASSPPPLCPAPGRPTDPFLQLTDSLASPARTTAAPSACSAAPCPVSPARPPARPSESQQRGTRPVSATQAGLRSSSGPRSLICEMEFENVPTAGPQAPATPQLRGRRKQDVRTQNTDHQKPAASCCLRP